MQRDGNHFLSRIAPVRLFRHSLPDHPSPAPKSCLQSPRRSLFLHTVEHIRSLHDEEVLLGSWSVYAQHPCPQLIPFYPRLDVTTRRQLGLNPTQALAAQEPFSRLVCFVSSAKGVLGVFLVDFSHGCPTSRHHRLSTRSRFHPFPLFTLSPPVNTLHTATDRRLRPRRI